MADVRVVAVVDVGSNSVRLLVARAISPEAFEVVDEERFDARLGEGQAGGDLSPAGIARGLAALRVMCEVARSYEPSALLVTGTEALRRAPNAGVLLAEAKRELGVDIRILSAEEEARASFLGAVNSTALSDGFVVDIGGGSLEVMRVEGRTLAGSQSVPLGAIYARERYFRDDPPSAKDVRALRKAVRQQIRVEATGEALYGVGGAVRNLARMVRLRRRYPLRRLHGLVIERAELRRLARDLAWAGADARRRLAGVSEARQDTLPAAAVVLDEVMTMTGAPALRVSGQGLREGLVWQFLRPDSPVLPDVRSASVHGLALANGIEAQATEPVAETAAMLFGATRTLHQLGPAEEDLLLVASRLAGIGMHVDFYQRDRHSEYLVHSGDLHGFSHREIVLLAAVARWATAGTPDLSPYRAIVEPEDPRRALVLAALLGAAQAVHRRRPSPVERVSCDLKHGELRLALVAQAPLEAELLALERQRKRLEAALKVTVRVEARW